MRKVGLAELQALAVQLQKIGYTIHTLRELADAEVKDAELTTSCLEAYADTHPHCPPTAPRKERQAIFLGSGCLREAFFVVMKGGRCVGFSGLRRGDTPGLMESMWDGVARSERPLEVPLRMALKGQEVAFAQAAGVDVLNWEVDSTDLAGMHILDALPFERGPEYQVWVRHHGRCETAHS